MVAALDQRGLLNEVCESVRETHTLPESDGEKTKKQKQKGLSQPKQDSFVFNNQGSSNFLPPALECFYIMSFTDFPLGFW